MTVADTIFRKLRDRYKQDQQNEWVDVYALAHEMGFSDEQVRGALRTFSDEDQLRVEIDHSTKRHVRLGHRGKSVDL